MRSLRYYFPIIGFSYNLSLWFPRMPKASLRHPVNHRSQKPLPKPSGPKTSGKVFRIRKHKR